uniref:Uncharacterized protein n=1 Tax=Timema monikensis TaxID=170555 RepID=A0A7R9EBG6_9NEOP|nr:unnamed protein product [Timema monikensis]
MDDASLGIEDEDDNEDKIEDEDGNEEFEKMKTTERIKIKQVFNDDEIEVMEIRCCENNNIIFRADENDLRLMPKIRRLRKGVVPSIFPWKKPDKDPPIEEGFSIARQSMQAITNITDNDSCSVKSEPVWYKKEAISIVEVDLYTQADELLKEVLHTHVASKSFYEQWVYAKDGAIDPH